MRLAGGPATVLVALTCLTACSGNPEPNEAEDATASDVSVEAPGVDVCALLTDGQVETALGIGPSYDKGRADEGGAQVCRWHNDQRKAELTVALRESSAGSDAAVDGDSFAVGEHTATVRSEDRNQCHLTVDVNEFALDVRLQPWLSADDLCAAYAVPVVEQLVASLDAA